MTTLTTWQADGPCPDCDTPLTLSDDGTGTAGIECSSCGYLDTWTLTSMDGGER